MTCKGSLDPLQSGLFWQGLWIQQSGSIQSVRPSRRKKTVVWWVMSSQWCAINQNCLRLLKISLFISFSVQKKGNILHLLNKRPFHQSVLVGFEHKDVGFEFCLCSSIHLPKSSKSAFFFPSPLGFELNYLLQNIWLAFLIRHFRWKPTVQL